jgi:hypothetical protein
VTILTRADDNGVESATIEPGDFTAGILSSGRTGKLEGAPSEKRPSHQFELSREELARDYRRLSIH